jgi:imidazolonepropionase-like amidohydrolase
MSPMDTILAATALGGELMARPDELGKVQPGYFADLILVRGNPLEHIDILSNQENIDVIFMVCRSLHRRIFDAQCPGSCLERSCA